MNLPEIVFFVVVPVLVSLIVLESRRQRKKYGTPRGSAASLTRAGLMEIQNLLEPERKVEILRDMERKEDLLVQIDDEAGPPKA